MGKLHQQPAPRRALMLAAVLALPGLAGCGTGMPATYPVKGKVVFKGGKPASYGRIEFQSLSDSTVKAIGQVGKDGSFTLTTHKEGRNTPGAVAGQHKVIVEQEGWDKPLVVIVVPTPLTVEERDNDLTIVVEKPRR
jgi:hypothetical protein